MTDLVTGAPQSPEAALDEAEGISVEPLSQWDLFITRLRRHRLAMASTIYLFIIIAVSFLAPLVTCPDREPYCGKLLENPNELLFDDNGRPFVDIAPRADFPFGTDDLGRDVLSRVIHGGRASLIVAGVVGLIVAVMGTIVGALAGYYPGPVDQALMRFVDLVLGLPLLPVAIVMGFALPRIEAIPQSIRRGPWVVALLLGSLLWGGLSRIVRGEFLSLREKEFVEAARAAGASDRRIIFRHILPNAMSPIIVQTTLIVGAAIIIEAALSFLGFGVPPPTPTWGGIVDAGGDLALRGKWWQLVFAGFALISTVLAVNFVGDGLRDALDPTQTIERK